MGKAITVHDDVRTTGRVAVVTGANRGIGYQIALQLARSGLFRHVVLACRDFASAEVAVASIRSKELADDDDDELVEISSGELTLGSVYSHKQFAAAMNKRYGKIDVLVNNAAIAYKRDDPMSFEGQTKTTLDVNFRGTVHLTETLLPLLLRGEDSRIVNVASMVGRLSQLSPTLRRRFSSDTLTMLELQSLVNDFEDAVMAGNHREQGWTVSNYGLSKLALIAFTKVLAREYPGIRVNACCPGFCNTDMTGGSGFRDAADGAKNAVIPAIRENPGSGQLFANYEVADWYVQRNRNLFAAGGKLKYS
jgi:carbonyl reductase 1